MERTSIIMLNKNNHCGKCQKNLRQSRQDRYNIWKAKSNHLYRRSSEYKHKMRHSRFQAQRITYLVTLYKASNMFNRIQVLVVAVMRKVSLSVDRRRSKLHVR